MKALSLSQEQSPTGGMLGRLFGALLAWDFFASKGVQPSGPVTWPFASTWTMPLQSIPGKSTRQSGADALAAPLYCSNTEFSTHGASPQRSVAPTATNKVDRAKLDFMVWNGKPISNAQKMCKQEWYLDLGQQDDCLEMKCWGSKSVRHSEMQFLSAPGSDWNDRMDAMSQLCPLFVKPLSNLFEDPKIAQLVRVQKVLRKTSCLLSFFEYFFLKYLGPRCFARHF